MTKNKRRELIKTCVLMGAGFGTVQALSIFVPSPSRSIVRFICGELMVLGISGALVPTYSRVYDEYVNAISETIKDPVHALGIDYYFGE